MRTSLDYNEFVQDVDEDESPAFQALMTCGIVWRSHPDRSEPILKFDSLEDWSQAHAKAIRELIEAERKELQNLRRDRKT